MRVRALVLLIVTVLALTGCTITIGRPRTDQGSSPPASGGSVARPAGSTGSARPAVTGETPTARTPAPSSPTTEASTATGDTSWTSLFERARPAVVRLQVGSCDASSWMGSGFALDDHLVMTAAHVVAQADTIAVKSDQGITAAHTIAYDLSTDSALVETDASFAGHTLKLSGQPLEPGADLAVLGYPLGVTDLRITTGIVSGLDSRADYGNFHVDHVFVTDAATNGGNSGGPVIDRTGAVIGLVSGGEAWAGSNADIRPVQNTNFVVPARSLRHNYQNWHQRQPATTSPCGNQAPPVGNGFTLDVTVGSSRPVAADLAQTLYLHGTSINTGNYEAAWNLFTPTLQRDLGSFTGWENGLATSYWDSLDIRRVSGQGSRLTAAAVLRTHQDAAYGGPEKQTCSDWDMRYRMRRLQGLWLIDHVDVRQRAAC